MKLNRDAIRRMMTGVNQGSSSEGSGGGGGGMDVTALADLRDTVIVDPQDGDILEYVEDDEAWENKEKSIPWPKVTDVTTSTGRDFNFLDGDPTGRTVFINSHKRDGTNLSSTVQDIYIYNGANAMAGVTVHAANLEASGQVTALSDERKKNVEGDMVLNLDDIANAPSVKFRWKDEADGKTYVGTIAQYWQKVMPEVVREAADGTLSMDYAVAALISSISLAKELKELKQTLKERGIL